MGPSPHLNKAIGVQMSHIHPIKTYCSRIMNRSVISQKPYQNGVLADIYFNKMLINHQALIISFTLQKGDGYKSIY